VRAIFSTPCQNLAEAPPNSSTIYIGSFPGVKSLEHGVNHPPPSSSAEVKERVAIPLLLVCVFMAGYRVKFALSI
jgi:hypothetical protein